MKIGINIFLTIVVIGLGIWLYKIIQDPIQFERQFNIRYSVTKDALKNIRTAQRTYLEIHGTYAANFDELVKSMKMDSILTITTIGDPNDTAVTVKYDTILEAILDVVEFEGKSINIDSLRYIPYSKGEQFVMQAGNIEKQRVMIPVFEAMAENKQYLRGLNPRFAREQKHLKVGSLTEGTDAGNWE